jgi:hypothetical protein
VHDGGACDCVIERHRKRLHGRARRITIDLDPTDDPTHGQQQFTFFNSHYGGYCYLPMVCFLTFDEEAEQYLVAAVLRRGNATGSLGALGILRRLIGRVSNAFPRARIRVRLDGGFASPEVLDFLDCEPKVKYLVNMAANAVLKRKAESAMKWARRASKISDQTEHVWRVPVRDRQDLAVETTVSRDSEPATETLSIGTSVRKQAARTLPPHVACTAGRARCSRNPRDQSGSSSSQSLRRRRRSLSGSRRRMVEPDRYSEGLTRQRRPVERGATRDSETRCDGITHVCGQGICQISTT